MSCIQVSNLSHYFFQDQKITEVLRNISFSINEGEFISLLGPSGCGKTTILSIISGLISPLEGEMQKNGTIGYMLQHDYLFPWKTIEENCSLGLDIMGQYTEEKKEEIAHLLKKVSLDNTSKLYPRHLSGGMRQRVALIRTLITNPQILLLDEPFSSLDYQNKIKLEELVFNILKQYGKTSILVTHDIEEAVAMSDRIFILCKKPTEIIKTITVPNEIRNLTPLKARNHSVFPTIVANLWKELEKIG